MIPNSPEELVAQGKQFHLELRKRKESIDLPWYPFDSLSALPVIAELLSRRFPEIRDSLAGKPMLDIGCGDGDLACLFSSFGVAVDALDSAATNFNGMAGVRALSAHIRTIYDLDLDSRFSLPEPAYGLTLFLGTLYHLKNPYYLLEQLAYRTEWCLLSTRVAQFTPRVNAPIEDEPVAYLADGREIDNDSTNYWIFSGSGLLRILQRTRWSIAAVKRIGATTDSDPIHASKDERMFVLAQSRVFHSGLQVRPASGWYAPGDHAWCWTAKRFALEVILPLETAVSSFELEFYLPPAAVPVRLSSRIAAHPCGFVTCETPGVQTLRGHLPAFALHEPRLLLEFEVESCFAGDGRELGICVATPIPLRVFQGNPDL